MNHLELIKHYKRDDFESALRSSIPVLNAEGNKIANLVPIGNWILAEKDIIAAICEWREKNMDMFLIRFESSIQKTEKYLRDLSIGKPNRLLFMVYSDGKMVGHIGLSDVSQAEAELDNVMKGEITIKNLMYYSGIALFNVFFSMTEIENISARVLSCNSRAISLYKKTGFHVYQDVPLSRHTDGDFTYHDFIVDKSKSNTPFSCYVMRLQKSTFLKLISTG